MKTKPKLKSEATRPEEHADTIIAYVESYRNYLLMWAHFVADSDRPSLKELRAELDKYLKAYQAYLRSEVLLIANTRGSGMGLESDTRRLFDTIEATIKTQRLYRLEMARLVSAQ
jgi:hypothetical protein